MKLRFFFDYYLSRNAPKLPLWFPDSVAQESDFPLSPETVSLCRRLSALFDQKINQNNPSDASWSMPSAAKEEFNRLLPVLKARIRAEIPSKFEIEFCQEPL